MGMMDGEEVKSEDGKQGQNGVRQAEPAPQLLLPCTCKRWKRRRVYSKQKAMNEVDPGLSVHLIDRFLLRISPPPPPFLPPCGFFQEEKATAPKAGQGR